MRKTLLAAIMAASALIPAAAFAEALGDPGQREGHGRVSAGTEGRTQWQRPDQGGARPQQQAPQREYRAPEVRAQAQVQVQAQPQAQPQQQPRFDRSDRGGRPDFQGGRPDGQGRGDFRGGRPDFQRGPAVAPVPIQPAQVQQQQQPPRNFGDGRRDGRPDWNAGQPQRGGDFRTDGRGGRPDGQRGYDNRGNDRREVRQDDRRGYNGGWNGNWNGNNRNWNRDWRRDNRYNYNAYRNQNRNAYRLPRYYAPYGWDYGYRRFSIGFTLSSILFNQDYWIDDADYYRLPPAYGPYRWVRYYNDALLVDIRTGYVVDTVYDIFW